MGWQKGQSGNPAGRQVGIRNKINDTFLRALARDFNIHGERVIEKVRKDDPARYLAILAALLPKQSEHKGEVKHEHEHHHDGAVSVSHTDALVAEIAQGAALQSPPKPKPN